MNVMTVTVTVVNVMTVTGDSHFSECDDCVSHCSECDDCDRGQSL